MIGWLRARFRHDALQGILFGATTVWAVSIVGGSIADVILYGRWMPGLVVSTLAVVLWVRLGRQFEWLPNDGAAPPPAPIREVNDVDPVDVARNYRENMARLAVTQERFAPRRPSTHVSAAECMLAGHEWVYDEVRMLERCTRCRMRRDPREFAIPHRFIAGAIDASMIRVGTIRPGAAVRLPFRDRDGERVEGRDAGVAEED